MPLSMLDWYLCKFIVVLCRELFSVVCGGGEPGVEYAHIPCLVEGAWCEVTAV